MMPPRELQAWQEVSYQAARLSSHPSIAIWGACSVRN